LRLPNEASYFFFDFALVDAFALDLAAGFFAVAMMLTTFHAVRDLTVAPIWQKTPEFSGSLKPNGR
jgi:hypothetical protein